MVVARGALIVASTARISSSQTGLHGSAWSKSIPSRSPKSRNLCAELLDRRYPSLFLIAVSGNWNTSGDALALRSAMCDRMGDQMMYTS